MLDQSSGNNVAPKTTNFKSIQFVPIFRNLILVDVIAIDVKIQISNALIIAWTQISTIIREQDNEFLEVSSHFFTLIKHRYVDSFFAVILKSHSDEPEVSEARLMVKD